MIRSFTIPPRKVFDMQQLLSRAPSSGAKLNDRGRHCMSEPCLIAEACEKRSAVATTELHVFNGRAINKVSICLFIRVDK